MTDEEARLRSEIGRLNKIITALMDRAERSIGLPESDFGLFQRALMLEQQVKDRTASLESALRENKVINRTLRVSEAKYRAVVNHFPVGIAITSTDRIILEANEACCAIFGVKREEAEGKTVRVLYGTSPSFDEIGATIYPLVMEGGTFSGHVPMQRRDGVPIVVDLACRLIDPDQASLGMVWVVEDITERLRLETELSRLAAIDPLSGILNRRSFMTSAVVELDRAKRHRRPVSLLMLDIDYFKRINDTHGHLAGDEAIKAMAAACAANIRGGDVLGRIGGEEFAILLPDAGLSEAVVLAERLRLAITQIRIPAGDAFLSFTSSIGAAEMTEGSSSVELLISSADAALYAAKRSGRNKVAAETRP